MAVLGLSPSVRQNFLHLRDNASTPFTHMSDAFAENCFAIHSNDMRRQTSIFSNAFGLFLLSSRFNHSCVPNAKFPTANNTDEIVRSFATRNIMVGEEITICYNPHFECMNRYERHQVLRFVCDCRACLPGTAFQKLSDMRRTFIRGLRYLTCGMDLSGHEQNSGSSLIIDPGLKKAAEEFCIPLSARLIYDLLALALTEQEGLLDDFEIKRLYPGVLKLSTLFQTEDNAKIASLAIVQKTWQEKFWVASKLYRRLDAADLNVTDGFRMLKGLPAKISD